MLLTLAIGTDLIITIKKKTMEKNFLKEIFDIEDKAHKYIVSLFEEKSINGENTLHFFDKNNEITYFDHRNLPCVEKVDYIQIGVHSDDDIVFITTLDNEIGTDMLVRGTIAQYVPIIEQEFERIANAINEQNELLNSPDAPATQMFAYLPDKYNPRDLTADQFVGRAFMYGEIMTAEEYADRFNMYQLGDIHPDKGTLRVVEIYDTCTEMCPHCENEVVLETKFCKQRCPICGRLIKPCNLCADCVSSCPLGEDD